MNKGFLFIPALSSAFAFSAFAAPVAIAQPDWEHRVDIFESCMAKVHRNTVVTIEACKEASLKLGFKEGALSKESSVVPDWRNRPYTFESCMAKIPRNTAATIVACKEASLQLGFKTVAKGAADEKPVYDESFFQSCLIKSWDDNDEKTITACREATKALVGLKK